MEAGLLLFSPAWAQSITQVLGGEGDVSGASVGRGLCPLVGGVGRGHVDTNIWAYTQPAGCP